MRPPPNRSWRFSHPDLGSGTPGLSTTHIGSIAMAEEPESVRQAVLLLLSTVPGERVMRSQYGCNLFRLVFSPNDDTTAGLAIHYVRQAIERWEPRIEIRKLDARRSAANPSNLEIALEYRIRRTGHRDLLIYTANLMGGGA